MRCGNGAKFLGWRCLIGWWDKDHVNVLVNTVDVAARHKVALFVLNMVLWRPGKVIAADFNVIISKFSQLVIIHSKEFGFLRSTEVQSRDQVDGVGDDGRDDEGVAGAGEDVC